MSQRLFQPLLTNPLHGGVDATVHTPHWTADNYHSSTALSRPILKQSHSSGCPDLHDPTPPLAPQEKSYSFSLDDSTMEIVPTYLVFPSQQGNKLAWTMPMLLQAGSNLEDVTRANLFPFMVSKELYGSVQHNPQLHSSSIHPRHHTPLHHTWQPASSSPTWSTMAKSKHVRRDNDAENDPVTSTGDSSSYVTDDDSNIPRNKRIRHNRSHHISSTHPIVLTQSLKSNTPWKHLSFRKQQERPLTKFQIYDWVNDLNSLWYLMEQGKYTQNEHERLISLLRKINKERDRPGLDLKWLKESKLVEVLKKYRKEESLHEYDPWVRRTASQIIRAWKARFEVHSNL